MAQTETGPARPWTQPPEEVAASLGVEPGRGLASDEVRQRRERHGPNRLRSAQRRSAWQILVEQFKSLLVALLAVAGLVSIVFGQVVEGIAILGVILINAAIGFFTELRAVRSMEALQQMATVDAKVRRDGQVREVPAEEVVPGDVLVLGGGDVVTADARLVEAS
ncbi:MAG: cation-transporting P-type ATPase, partial [Anaerolineae bacterium]